MATEADTCRTWAASKLQEMGWGAHYRRADQVEQQQASIFDFVRSEGRVVLCDLLEKHTTDGKLQFAGLEEQQTSPIVESSNMKDVIGKFSGVGY